MHRSPNAKKVTILVTDDVRRQLEIWASRNITSLSAELMRSARERMEREAEKAVSR